MSQFTRGLFQSEESNLIIRISIANQYISKRDVIIFNYFSVKLSVCDLLHLYFEVTYIMNCVYMILKCNVADLTFILTPYEGNVKYR